ncbi:hypothetical protein VQ574_20830 (plasmid) [Stutzerimonas frequens]|uniref:hypothetical protein n=1 Tax=Stutzerimonas frequens TaxID=2968969 RepID=UPI002DBC7722|nr:hypothetical protein [Stutzerimonas frequens]WRW29385.1 hypothetical protein VQ574_20830 [Stutzerimonas frequens]
MDIKSFLSSGTTHVHTKEPQGNFAKAAKAAVLALCLGATGAADNAMAEVEQDYGMQQAAKVAQMPYAGDAVSIIYQALLAPEATASVRVVSTRSSSIVSMLQAMPKQIQQATNSTPDSLLRLVDSMDDTPYAMTVGIKWKSWMAEGSESVCMVNGLEVVGDHVQHANGAPYVSLAQLNVGADQLSSMAALSTSEAAQVTMIHELAHCEFNNTSLASAEPPGSKLEQVFRLSFNEAAADLAVALYYASKEGSFTNARLAISSVRANSDNGDHTTLGMLDQVLATLDPEAFKGMPINALFQQVTPIMNEAWIEQNADLRKAFLEEIVEGELLHNRLNGHSTSMTVEPELLEAFESFAPGFSYNPYARAHEKIDDMLDHGLRNPDFQRQIGLITVAKIEDSARKMGVPLTPDQIIKARYLDPQFSPPGTKGEVGLAGTAQLREVNYMSDLTQQAKQNINKHIISAPRFN